MTFSPYIVVFLGLVALTLVFAVPTWLFLRQESMRHDIADSIHKVELMHADYQRFLEIANSLRKEVADTLLLVEAGKVRDLSTQETIRSLMNKFTSRERVASRERNKAEREEVNQQTDVFEQPPTEERLLRLGAVPMGPQTVPLQPEKPKRKFGVLP